MNEKIEYFISYWRDLTHPNNSIEVQFSHIILYNPKELFKEFADEIRIKKLSNKDNKIFFIKKVNQFSNLNLKALNCINPTLKLIKEQFSKKDDYSYLLHLCEQIVIELSDFKLAYEVIDELTEVLLDNTELDKEKIKHLTNILIFELTHKKYSSQSIIGVIDNIMSTYQITPDGYLHTNFPHNKSSDAKSINSPEYKEYVVAVKSYIDSLTLEDRLLSLKTYFEKQPEKIRYIFQIKGLRGDDINLHFGNVQIYNPKTTQLLKSHIRGLSNEYFDDNIEANIHYCNAAVTVEAIDNDFAKDEALKHLDSILDIIASLYQEYSVPLSINSSKYLIINEEGRNIGAGNVNNWNFLTFQDSLEITDDKYKKLSTFYSEKLLMNNLPLSVDKKILESIHWKRKAIESIENNEKILWNWVAIENLINSPSMIFNILSKLFAKRQLIAFAWKHLRKIEMITNKSAPLYHYQLEIKIPDNIKEEIGFKKEGKVNLKDFTHNLNLLDSYINQNILINDQIENLSKIFTDSQVCLELLETFEDIAYEKLIYVYRIRNKIMHNANNEENPLLYIYADFISESVSYLVNEFVNKRYFNDFQTYEEILHNIIYDYEKFKINLNEKGTEILL